MICKCKEILNLEKVYIHLSGCPETKEVKEYQKLRWFNKIFKKNPANKYYWYIKS